MSEPANGRAEMLAIGLLCGLAILSDLAYAGLTPLVVAYSETLHFDLATAGWLASAEGAGFTLGALLAAVGGRHVVVTRARVAIAFVVLAVAQLLSAGTAEASPLAAYRAASGTAAGLIYAVGNSAVATSRNPGRGFSLYFGALFVAGIIALGVIPTSLKWLGLRGSYMAYAALILACLPAVRWYPVTPARAGESARSSAIADTAPAVGRWTSGLLQSSLFINFIFNGGLWVLAEHFGLQIKGTDAQSLGGLLAGTMLFGLVGTALATLAARRLSELTSIVIGNLGLIVAMIVMSAWHTVTGLIVAMAFLNVSVTFLTPPALTAIAATGEHGARWGNLAIGAGYSVGPAAIAAIATHSGMDGLVSISVAGFLGSAGLAWLGLAGYRRRSSPARS